MTTIHVSTIDQILTATVLPKIACNNQNTIKLHVSFCEAWDGYGKTAIFYTSKNPTVYEKVLSSDDICFIPPEVLTETGHLFIGVKGIDGSSVKMSTILRYKIEVGTPMVVISEPTEDVYNQLLTAYGETNASLGKTRTELNNRITETKAEINNAMATANADLSQRITTESARLDNIIAANSPSVATDVIRINVESVKWDRFYITTDGENAKLVIEGLSETRGGLIGTYIAEIPEHLAPAEPLQMPAATESYTLDYEATPRYIVLITNVDGCSIDYLEIPYTLAKPFDPELPDIRVGADGTIYDCAGEAVRTQFNSLNGDMAVFKSVENPTIEVGSISAGVAVEMANRARTTAKIRSYRTLIKFNANVISNYNYGYAIYNENGEYDGVDRGWNDPTAKPELYVGNGYFRMNFMRRDDADITAEDIELLQNSITIIRMSVKDEIDELKETVYKGFQFEKVFSLEVGTLTEGINTPHANRARFVDKVKVSNKTTIKIAESTTYLYGYAVYNANGVYDGVDHGWNSLESECVIEFEKDGFVKLNLRRVDDTAITEADIEALKSLITINERKNMADMAEALAKEADKTDAINSINIEYGRRSGASYVFVRIPKITNSGKAIKPKLKFTSANESISGAKVSTLKYARTNGCIFAINGGLFNTETLQPVGQTIIDGVSYVNTPMTDDMGSPISDVECYPLCIDSNGDLGAPYARSIDTADMIADGVVHAVTGWGKVVENFYSCSDTVENEIVHAGKYIRQVIGQYQNGDYFVCTVDMSRGSVENEAGIEYSALASFLMSKGVKFAYSLDGGGSAETVIGNRQLNPIYEGEAGRAVPTVIVFEIE